MNNQIENELIPDVQIDEVSEETLSSTELMRVQGLVQTKTRYQTAVQVIKKRSLPDIISRVESEAALAGEDFYYSYPQGGKYIEGVGINGALILARNWGNNSVEVRPFDIGDKYILIGDFVDFETGFNLSRPFLLKKKILKTKNGKAIYDKERNDEIVFQIGTSKAMRNVILNAIPNYVIEAGIKKAKEGYRKKLEEYVKKNGLDKAREMTVKRAERLNVPIERVELNFGKTKTWDIDKILLISGALKGIEEGYHSVNDAFPKEIEKFQRNGFPDDKSQSDSPEARQNLENINNTATALREKNEFSEIEKVEVEEAEKENKFQRNGFPNAEKETNSKRIDTQKLSPEDWENPDAVIKAIKFISNISELRKFKKDNKERLEAFGGSDRDKIINVLIEQEKLLSK